MKRRSPGNNYKDPGFYHITINVYDRKKQSLGRIIGDLQCPDGHANAPRVELTAIGKMVEYELLHSITRHYPVIEIQDYVVMPEHMHFIVNVKNSLISKNGRQTHLGQVIAGFKEGCNRRYWEIIQRAKPAETLTEEDLRAKPALALTNEGRAKPAEALINKMRAEPAEALINKKRAKPAEALINKMRTEPALALTE